MADQKLMTATADDKIIYSPALRLKEGEYKALSQLPPAVMERVTPFFIAPPPKEGDIEKGRMFATSDEAAYITGERVGHYWPLRTSFVDSRFLLKEFKGEDASNWLPRLFQVARHCHGKPVPVATLNDMVGSNAKAFQLSMSVNDPTKLGIRITFGEIDHTLSARVTEALQEFELSPTDCAVFLDFADADMADVEGVASFINVAVETLVEIGTWRNIVFQGTNYPAKNPANPGMVASVPRNEWHAWDAAVKTDPGILRHCAFGDYGADCAPLDLKGGGIPIVHYRYCTPEDWKVVRAADGVQQRDAMRAICKQIVAGAYYSGHDFSEADKYIHLTAQGLTTGGGATLWREMNTIHHITMVISQLGKMLGFTIEHQTTEKTVQGELF